MSTGEDSAGVADSWRATAVLIAALLLTGLAAAVAAVRPPRWWAPWRCGSGSDMTG